MYCPRCSAENSDDKELRFCRSCGTDLRTVARALNRSLTVRLASSLDAYMENRFQQNLRSGVLNVLAFVFLVIAGTSNLMAGWTTIGIVLLVLSLVAIVSGVWDIWIYKRNLPRVATNQNLPTGETKDLNGFKTPANSITESTTKLLDQK